MTREEFFEKFELLADTPGSVAKIRELILECAAAGKLGSQSASDESAFVLLSSIEKNLDLLRERREVRNAPVEPLTCTENLPSLPTQWTWVRLGNVVDYGSALKVDSAEIPEDAWLLDLEDIEKDTSRLLTRKRFADNPSKSTKAAFAAGNVLYGKLRPYLNKVLVADEPGYCTTEIVPIRTFGFIEPLYLCYALRRPSFLAYANSKSYGMNLPRLGTEDARMAPFPLPPLDEQKRIVAKVDELMALCEQLEAQQKERETRQTPLARASVSRFADAPTAANLTFLFHKSYTIGPADLRKTILAFAVQGRLVRKHPSDEPAEELIKRIKDAKKKLLIERRIRQSEDVEYALEDQGDDAPPGWVGLYVADVAIIQGGKRLPNGALFSESPTPHVYIRVTDMKNGTISETGLRYITPEVRQKIARYTINKEDLYITIAGTIGDVGSVPESLDGHNLTENAAKIVFRGFDRRFFQLALTSEFVQAQFLNKTKQMAQPKLALKRIAGAKFYLPPLAEQRRIVAKVDQLMALVDELETQLAASRTTAAKLLDAIVGELTA